MQGKSYFRIIQTSDSPEGDAARAHETKLNNYRTYGWTGEELPPGATPLSYEIVVKHMSTSTATKNHAFIITTVLCCEDKYEDAGTE